MKKLEAIKTHLKSGDERITYNQSDTKYTLLDFWRWSLSDIMSNTIRGRFAEFIVGTAIDLNLDKPREEWDAYDLITIEGIKIEIKSASYIQSWNQTDYSSINFSIKPAKHWDAEDGALRGDAKRHADIYVFCLLKHKEQETIDPLKMEQWDFFVVPTHVIDSYNKSQNTISLSPLSKIAQLCSYDNLKEEIYKAYEIQRKSENNLR